MFEKVSNILNFKDSLKNNLLSSKENENITNSYLIEPEDSELKQLKLQIIGNETTSFSSDVTDNYVENNVAYQDHISLKPIVYTIEGEVGELTWYAVDSPNSVLGSLQNKLEPIASFAQVLSGKASQIQQKVIKVLDVVDSIDNYASRLYNFFSQDGNMTEQQRVYKYLLVLWTNREPICIKTPWMKLKDYVIQNIEFYQSGGTSDKSKIKISFKEFKVVKSKTAKFDQKKYLGRGSAQNASIVNKGTTTGVKATSIMAKAKQWCPKI